MAYLHSGNGRQIHIALAFLAQSEEVKTLVQQVLASLDALFSTQEVAVDRSLCDAKRILPACGTVKRKGAPNVVERPHRQTAIVTPPPERLRRLTLDDLHVLAKQVGADAGSAASTNATTLSPAPQAKHRRTESRSDPDDPWKLANALDPREVATWLGVVEGGTVRCPGCGETSGVDVIEHGLKCFHNRCASKGREGFRTNIDLTMEVRGVNTKEAYALLGEQFGLQPLRKKRKHSTPSIEGAEAPNNDRRKDIIISPGELYLNVEEAIGALRDDPNLYQSNGHLVHTTRVTREEVEQSPIVDALDEQERRELVAGTLQIREMSRATICERLTRFARFLKLDKRSDQFVAAAPSDRLVGAVHDRGEWTGIRPIVGVAETPFFTVGHRLVQAPGHDPKSGYLYEPTISFGAVDDAPTQEQARAAYKQLEELLMDFPFVSGADRGVVIAAMLTIVSRPAIQGAVPAFVFDANARGVGKSLLTDVIAEVTTGRSMPRKIYPDKDEELEKALGAYALKGSPFCSLDNVNRPFGGGPLDAVLTTPDTVDLRVLGAHDLRTLVWLTIIFATGNNFTFVGDTADRVLKARIETDLENSRARTDFRFDDLRVQARTHRATYVRALVTILQAYVIAGRPNMKCPRWGSFEAWSRLIPHAIVFAGGADPMQTRILDETEVNEDVRNIAGVLAGWERLQTTIGDGEQLRWRVNYECTRRDQSPPKQPPPKLHLTGKEILGALYEQQNEPEFDAMRGSLESLCCPGRKSGEVRPTVASLSAALRKFSGRPIAGRRLRHEVDSHTKVAVFWVEPVDRG